jgi:hypothetical protein
VILGQNPPEIAYWERGEWWLAGEAKPRHPEAGIERGKARRVASVTFDAIHDNVARKVDVLASETALRADIQALRHDLQSSDARLDARITAVRADLALVEHRLLTRLGGLAVVLSGIIIAVLHYWQPHG